MSEGLPKDENKQVKIDAERENSGEASADAALSETEPTVVEKMRDVKAEHDEILAEAYRWVIADLTPGVTIFLAVASAAGLLLLIGWYSGRSNRGQRYGNTKVDFFPAGPDSIVVNR